MRKLISVFLAVILLTSALILPFDVSAATKRCEITSSNPTVIIRWSYTTGTVSKKGNDGTKYACLQKKGKNYILYDTVIWNDCIKLYQFKENIDDEWSKFCSKFDRSTEPDRHKFDEKYCIGTYKYKDDKNKSKYLKNAFVSVCKKVSDLSPSSNTVLKWSGHGFLGLFGMSISDAQKAMDSVMDYFGHKFALIDFSSNCDTSSNEYINLYHPYTEYLLTSQTLQGGYSMDNWDSKKYEAADDDSQYANIFTSSSTIGEACKKLIDLNDKWWPLCKKDMKKNKAEESNTLLDMSAYKEFYTEYKKCVGNKRLSFGTDLYKYVTKYGSKKLKSLYKSFVLYYKANTKYVKWKTKQYGVSMYDNTLTYRSLSHKNNVFLSSGKYRYYNSKGRKDTKKSGAVKCANGATYYLSKGIALKKAVRKVDKEYRYFNVIGKFDKYKTGNVKYNGKTYKIVNGKAK